LTTFYQQAILSPGVFKLPRKARRKSESGIYHIIMRGINRQQIFKEDEDCHRFLQTLKYYKETCGYEIYAYCLMSNHIHLLLKVGSEPLEQIMRRICGKFVYWYNHKYDRTGYLFQDRFKSEPVEDDAYFLTALRYIHQNPLKAGMVKTINDYPWSSHNAYLSGSQLIDADFALNMFAGKKTKALDLFIRFNEQSTNERCLDIEESKTLSDQEALEIIESMVKVSSIDEWKTIDRATRDSYLEKLKQKGLSVRQISRLTGLNRGVVLKA
jgi:putative transposase